MSTIQSQGILTSRDRDILRDIIRAFILTGDPVSSRSVAKMPQHELSAASIRNVMADLEDRGLLVQPHTSAGRVPTEAGYHLYIDSLMPMRTVPARARRYIDENLASGTAPDELMTATSNLLSELSEQIGIVLTPAMGDTVLRTISFIQLSEMRLLCVVVSESGFVDNKVIDVEEMPSREELVRISNYLTDNFSGLTLGDARDRLLHLMAEHRAQVDRLLSEAIDLAGRALGLDDERELLVKGTSAVLGRPELSDLSRIRRLLDMFSHKARLVGLLNLALGGHGVRVLIGEDSDLTSELDFSLVSATYGIGGRPLGTLGIFGPSRMPYQRIIPLVSYLGERLSEALVDSESDRLRD